MLSKGRVLETDVTIVVWRNHVMDAWSNDIDKRTSYKLLGCHEMCYVVHHSG